MAFCRQCGAKHKTTGKFCRSCGAAVAQRTANSTVAQPSTNPAVHKPQTHPRAHSKNTSQQDQGSIAWQAGVGALSRSLALSALVLGPGFLLLSNGRVVLGMIWLFLGSFGLMAWSYRKPWRLGALSCLIPPVTAGACYLVQLWLFGNAMPPFILILLAIGAGAALGQARAKTHVLYQDKSGAVIAQRTIAYLGIWVACYGITQLLGFTAREQFLVQGGLVSGAFSTAMLATVSVMLYQRRKTFINGGATAIAATLLLLASSIVSSVTSLAQDTIRLNQLGHNAVSTGVRNSIPRNLGCQLQLKKDRAIGSNKHSHYIGGEVEYRCKLHWKHHYTLRAKVISNSRATPQSALSRLRQSRGRAESNKQRAKGSIVRSIRNVSIGDQGFLSTERVSGKDYLKFMFVAHGIKGPWEIKIDLVTTIPLGHQLNGFTDSLAVQIAANIAQRLPSFSQNSGRTANNRSSNQGSSGYVPDRSKERGRRDPGDVVDENSIIRPDDGTGRGRSSSEQGSRSSPRLEDLDLNELKPAEPRRASPPPQQDYSSSHDTVDHWVPVALSDPESAASAAALISLILLAGGIGANMAQAIATALAGAVQATAETTAQEVSDAVLKQRQTSGPRIVDPSDGTAFETNEHGQYWAPDSDGNWRWLTESEARQAAAALSEEAQERDAQISEFNRGTQARRDELRQQGHLNDLEADAASREAIAQTAAHEDIDRIQKAADRVGDEDVKSRILSDRIYRADGSIDEDYIRRVKETLRSRIAQDNAVPDHKLRDLGNLGIAREFVRGSMKDASDSFVSRLVFGAASGGMSEAVFQGYATVEGIQKSAHAAEDAGKEMSRFDALKQAGSDFVKENMPINTADAMNRWRKGEDVSWSEVGMSMFADAAAVMDIKEATGLSPGNMADAAAKRALSESTYTAAKTKIDSVVDGVSDRVTSAKKQAILTKDAALEKLGLKSEHRLSATQAEARFNETSLSDDTREIVGEAQASGATRELDEAFQSGRESGRQKVAAFEKATNDLEAAKASGTTRKADLDALQRRKREEWMRVQADKHAMNELNALGKPTGHHNTIKAFNEETDSIYRNTDKPTSERLAREHYNTDPENIKPLVITNEKGPAGATIDPRAPARDTYGQASKWSPDGQVSNSRAAEASSASTRAPDSSAPNSGDISDASGNKSGMDRDVTYRVKSHDPHSGRVVEKDIPAPTTARVYNEELYKELKGIDHAPTPGRTLTAEQLTKKQTSIDFKDQKLTVEDYLADINDVEDADKVAKLLDQATTDSKHPEAYDTGQHGLNVATKDSYRGADFVDPGAVAKTVEFKVDHWMKDADMLRKAADDPKYLEHRTRLLEKSTSLQEESQRQLVKQYKNMVVSRTRAMQMLNNAPDVSIPRSLSERVNVLKSVQSGDLTPSQAEEVLKRMGSSTTELASQMSSYVEGLQKLRAPSHVPGIKPAPALVVQGWKDDFQRDQQQPGS